MVTATTTTTTRRKNNNSVNKYNVKAIREELDGYVRHYAWKNFRRRFMTELLPPPSFFLQGGDHDHHQQHDQQGVGGMNDDDNNHNKLELCRAVIEYKPHTNRAGGSGGCGGGRQSLLHVLCSKLNSEQHGRPPVPFDVIFAAAQVCPHLLLLTHGKKQQTPLHILLDKGAPSEWIQHIVELDDSRHSHSHQQHPGRSMLCIQDYKGDTPLLYAVRYRKDDASALVRVLLKGRKSCRGRGLRGDDDRKQDSNTCDASLSSGHRRHRSSSLLIPSKKGKIPLYYVVHEELKDDDDCYDDHHHGHHGDGRLPAYLVYLLLETQKAVVEEEAEFGEDGRINKDTNPKYDDEGSLSLDDDSSSSWLYSESDEYYSDDNNNNNNNYYWSRLLHATITCSHFLTERKLSSKLFRVILSHMKIKKKRQDVNDDDAKLFHYVDDEEHQNNLVHCMCRSKESNAFLQKFEDDFDGKNKNQTNILEAISKRDPDIMKRLNLDGFTPLQLAIQKRKPIDFVLALIHTAPDSVKNFATDSSRSVMGSSSSLVQINLPLHLMLTSWDTKCLVSSSQKQQNQEIVRRRFYTNDEIFSIYKLYPEALSVTDHVTKLHPWQLSGLGSCQSADPKDPTKQDQDQRQSPKNSSSRSTNSKDASVSKPTMMNNDQRYAKAAANDVSLIYKLLRVAPQVLLSEWNDK